MNERTNMIKMGKHIAELRKSKGYTQKNLGDILDVSDKTVSKWEKGVVAPDITILKSLSKTLDVSIEEILTGEEVKEIDTVEAIDFYSKITKRKLIKAFAIFFLIFILCVFFIFRIENYYSWHFRNIDSNGDIRATGYILYNNKESKLVVNKFYVHEVEIKDKIKKAVIEIVNKDETIYYQELGYEDPKELNEILSNYVISTDYTKQFDGDIIIKYTFIDVKNIEKQYSFIFK